MPNCKFEIRYNRRYDIISYLYNNNSQIIFFVLGPEACLGPKFRTDLVIKIICIVNTFLKFKI